MAECRTSRPNWLARFLSARFRMEIFNIQRSPFRLWKTREYSLTCSLSTAGRHNPRTNQGNCLTLAAASVLIEVGEWNAHCFLGFRNHGTADGSQFGQSRQRGYSVEPYL